MLKHEDVVGHRIKRIVADATLTDDSLNFADFVIELDNGVAFRLPYDDESDDWFGAVELTVNHRVVTFPKWRWWHYSRRLWRATISDVLVPADTELRYPDSARVALSSGWFLAQMSGAAAGILPCIDIMEELNADDPMITVWPC
jgi:hypothetical protein